MAKVRRNTLINGLNGIIAEHWLLKRDKAGRTILARKPVFAEDREFSEAQKKQIGKFREATIYAKSAVIKEAIYTEMAAGTARTAYNVAIADWFHPPEIEMIDLSGWAGRQGDSIHIRALDNVMVKRVAVIITGDEGRMIEQGEAVQEVDDSWWVYKTRQAAPAQASVTAMAEDLPGNITQEVAQMLVQAEVA